MGKRILLTGATGFLGSNILKAIAGRHEIAILTRQQSNLSRIEGLQNDFRNYVLDSTNVEDAVSEFKPEIIIHCATDYGRKSVPRMQIVEANLILPLKLIHAAHKAGTRMFVNTDTFLDKGINHYSLSKKQFNEWFHTYSGDMLCVNMILEHFYGPFDDKTKFVSFIINELLAEKPEINLTEGTQKRNFIFIDDVVSAFQSILEHEFEGATGYYDYFVASERTVAIKDLVILLKELCSNNATKLNFGAIPFRDNEVMDSSVDISAMRALRWLPKINLAEGLRRTVEQEQKSRKHDS